MRVDHQQAFRDWLQQVLQPLTQATSHVVTVPAAAVVVGVEHRIVVAGHTVRYEVEAGDTAIDVATMLAADAADLATIPDPITATAAGADVTFTRATAFPVLAEAPLTTPAAANGPPVIWARGNAPQPDVDYVLLDAGQDTAEGRQEVEQAVHAVMETTTVRSMRLQQFDITLMGSWPGMASRDVRRQLEAPASMLALLPYSVRGVAVLLDASAQNDNMWAPRIVLSITLAYADAHRVEADVIESVDASGTVGTQTVTVTAN